MGRRAYPHADSLLITADAGGSNGPRVRLWKYELQKFADRTGLSITICHFPPGTSKWKKIEQRLFSHAAMTWRSRHLVSLAAIVSLIGSTTTTSGLRIRSEIDHGSYIPSALRRDAFARQRYGLASRVERPKAVSEMARADVTGLTPPYRPDPKNPRFWYYGHLRIQAAIGTHLFARTWAQENLRAGARVLDVAAGQGALAQQLMDDGFNVSCTAWDDRCRVDAPTYRIDLDQSFSVSDLVTCVEVIEHLENPARFLRDCRSLLADTGVMVLTTPNVESASARLQWLLRGQPRIFSGDEVRNNRHISMMWRDQIEFLIELAGLEVRARGASLDNNEGGSGIRGFVNRALRAGVARFCSGEPDGESRMYVLAAVSKPRVAGPHDVY
jgi:2-polyprenyl-3-methyl-5-hydroxy-6-metoxy-1,4-benzoquinol methylase